MEEWICQQNIERWNDQLKATDDERRRTILVEFIGKEREKLKRLNRMPTAMAAPIPTLGPSRIL